MTRLPGSVARPRTEERAKLDTLWQEGRSQKKQTLTCTDTSSMSDLAREIFELAQLYESAPLFDAFKELARLELLSRGYRDKVRKDKSSRPKLRYIAAAMWIDSFIRRERCSKQRAFEHAAWALEIDAPDFDQAVRKVEQHYRKGITALQRK